MIKWYSTKIKLPKYDVSVLCIIKAYSAREHLEKINSKFLIKNF